MILAFGADSHGIVQESQDAFNVCPPLGLAQVMRGWGAQDVHCLQKIAMQAIDFFPFTLFSNLQQGMQAAGEPQKNIFRARLAGQDPASR